MVAKTDYTRLIKRHQSGHSRCKFHLVNGALEATSRHIAWQASRKSKCASRETICRVAASPEGLSNDFV